jgi:cytochrome b561
MTDSAGPPAQQPLPTAAPHGDEAGFGLVTRAIHWLTALMLLGSFAVVWSVGWLPAGPARVQAVSLHRTIGLLVLSVTVLRVLWRLVSRRPRGIGTLAWRWAAGVVHATLLASLLLVPLLGWAYTNARGHTLLLLGIRLPSLIFKDQYFSRVAITGHEFLAYALLALIGAHAAAAIWHHVVLRDATLKRMWRG